MLGEFLSPRRVFMDLVAEPKPELLRTMARRLADLGEVADAETLARRLIAREEMVTTGVKTGFAFPHAFSPQVDKLTLTIGVVPGGADFESLDGEPVEFILLLLGPRQGQAHHLRVLARLSRIARDPSALENLRAAETAEAVVELFIQFDRQLAEVAGR